MPVISCTERKTPKGRLVMACIYVLLALGAVTMVYPFLVIITGSVSNSLDYERKSVLPRFLWSREDRYMRFLASHFPPQHRDSIRQMRACFPDFPEDWQTWTQIGDETAAADSWAQKQLRQLDDPQKKASLKAAAEDYRSFMRSWDLRETVLAYNARFAAPFLRRRYGTLEKFNKAWEMSVDDFSKVIDSEWKGEPIDQQGYVPPDDARYMDLLAFREGYRENRFTPYMKNKGAYAGYLRPASLRYIWEEKLAESFGGKIPKDLQPVQFPVEYDAPPQVRKLWGEFLAQSFPLRHIQISVDATRHEAYRQFVAKRFRNPDYFNKTVGASIRSWDEVKLTPTVPAGDMSKVWIDYVRTHIPVSQWMVRKTLPDKAFQDFVLQRHGSLAKVNSVYGTQLPCIRQLRIPLKQSLLMTFANCEGAIAMEGVTTNYSMVFDYMFHRGLAIRNTIILLILTMLFTLTVNPLAGYALSRFKLRWSEKIIVFCLVTMAFPAAVAAIPGFLLLRDLHLLNTFWALVLPGAANGMSIFLLKGFFDSLPKELYEAATIDGAHEWRIFWQISVPLVKPILAVSMLSAFLIAYNGWEWAIIVCQDPKMWTVAVWTYQFFQLTGSQPQVMAAFIVNSLPVLLVFLLCQKVILRGIILPQMK